jgi:hypothetical protein
MATPCNARGRDKRSQKIPAAAAKCNRGAVPDTSFPSAIRSVKGRPLATADSTCSLVIDAIIVRNTRSRKRTVVGTANVEQKTADYTDGYGYAETDRIRKTNGESVLSTFADGRIRVAAAIG